MFELATGSLQQTFDDFNCIILNYTGDNIHSTFFYSIERYEDFLNGVNCMAGNGVYSHKQKLDFEIIPDNKLVIVHHDGLEVSRYRFIPLFRPTIEYKNNKNNKVTITINIRKNVYNNQINILVNGTEAKSFTNLIDAKQHLKNYYGNYKISDWHLYE